jgi:hypothetical protein
MLHKPARGGANPWPVFFALMLPIDVSNGIATHFKRILIFLSAKKNVLLMNR